MINLYFLKKNKKNHELKYSIVSTVLTTEKKNSASNFHKN